MVIARVSEKAHLTTYMYRCLLPHSLHSLDLYIFKLSYLNQPTLVIGPIGMLGKLKLNLSFSDFDIYLVKAYTHMTIEYTVPPIGNGNRDHATSSKRWRLERFI